MAELGVVASVIQIADTGLRLSIKLFTFGEVVASADKSVISISKDVSLTSSVLKALGQILDTDSKGNSRFLTQNAVKTADDAVKECLEVFEEMEKIIIMKLPNLRARGLEKASKATILLERLKWPYLLPKLQLLQSNLDRLKSTILLMLNVITYARSEPDHIIADQKSLIEDLAESNQDYVKTFENHKLGIEAESFESVTTQSSCRDPAKPACQPHVNLLAIGANTMDAPSIWDTTRNPFETHTQPGNDPRFTKFQHYLSMITAVLNEIDKAKYSIQTPSRSRVRVAIHDTFDQEMHYLAHPFGDHWLKLAKNHFASFVEASRNNFSPNAVKVTAYRSQYSASELSRPCPQVLEKDSDVFMDILDDDSAIYAPAHEAPDSIISDQALKPQCWDHGCNGRQFGTFSDLLRHQQEKSSHASTNRSGPKFARKSAGQSRRERNRDEPTEQPRRQPPFTMSHERNLESKDEDGDAYPDYPMAAHTINRDIEFYDERMLPPGMVTYGGSPVMIGKEAARSGVVVGEGGENIGERTRMEDIPKARDEALSPEELEKQKTDRTQEDEKDKGNGLQGQYPGRSRDNIVDDLVALWTL